VYENVRCAVMWSRGQGYAFWRFIDSVRDVRERTEAVLERIGLERRRDVQAGAEELRAIFERIGMTPETFEHRTFTRLKQLQHLLGTEQVGPELFWLQEAAAA